MSVVCCRELLSGVMLSCCVLLLLLTSCSARSKSPRSKLSLWIDGAQIASFLGYPLDVFIISDGSVVPYLLDPNFNKNIPVIPSNVDTVNLTWEAGHDMFTYWFDDLQSLDENLLYRPLLSIPASGVIPEGPKIFQMSIPCTGRDDGIAALELGLQIFNKRGIPIRGSPMKLKLKKLCEAIVPSTLCKFECLNGGRCSQHGFCECAQGFHGPRCEKSMCDPGCENNGTCMSPEVCICPDGFSGKRCERALCESPCQHGGRCIQKNTCWCTFGYQGKTCQFSKCKPRGQHGKCKPRCQHGGTCIGINRCKCPVGYQGPLCEKKGRFKRKKEKKPNRNIKGRKKKKRRRKKKRKNLSSKKKRKTKKNKKRKNKKARRRRKKKTLLAEVIRFSRRKRKRLERERRRKAKKLLKAAKKTL